MASPKNPQALFDLATKVRPNAYCQYSRYRVSCALVTNKGNLFGGVNVENASFGATICAERSAIMTMVTQGEREIEEILIITDSPDPAPPCGECLQVMSEFSTNDTKVHLAGPDGIKKTLLLKDIMPFRYDEKSLKSGLS